MPESRESAVARPLAAAVIASTAVAIISAALAFLLGMSDWIAQIHAFSILLTFAMIGWLLFDPSWHWYVALCVPTLLGVSVWLIPSGDGASLGDRSTLWAAVGLALLCLGALAMAAIAVLGWFGLTRGARMRDGVPEVRSKIAFRSLAALVLAVLSGIGIPRISTWARLRMARARFEAFAIGENLDRKKNIALVKAGMDRSEVRDLLGAPMLSGTTESPQPEQGSGLTDVFSFIDRIEWGEMHYNIHGVTVNVEYASDDRTAAKVEVHYSDCIHCDCFKVITAESLENAVRSHERRTER